MSKFIVTNTPPEILSNVYYSGQIWHIPGHFFGSFYCLETARTLKMNYQLFNKSA